MRRLRQWHAYLGVFFTPLLLLFVATGWYQMFDTERLKQPGDAETLVQKLRAVHTDQVYPETGRNLPASAARRFKLLAGVMSAAIIATSLLGLVLAFRFDRDWRRPAAALLLGVAVPVLVLWLGSAR